MVSALDLQAESHGFEFRSSRENFQTINTPSSYSTRLLDMPWVEYNVDRVALGERQGNECAWVIQESKAVQMHIP